MASIEYELLVKNETSSGQLINDKKLDLKVFQNHISIDSANKIEQVKIFNYAGALMKTVEGGKNNQVEFSHTLPNGIYIILIEFEFPYRELHYQRYLVS